MFLFVMDVPFTFASLPEKDWNLLVAIADATEDSREAPWYGPWYLVLRDCIFDRFCKPPFLTITYSQYPVSKDIDTYDSEDNTDADDNDTDDTQDYIRSAAPSPEAVRTPSPQTTRQTSSPQAFRGSTSEPTHTPSKFKTSRSRTKRSTRIPDFVQLLYQINVNSDGTINRPVKYQKHILLLVEIKKSSKFTTSLSFTDVFRQTDEQARHAFAISSGSDRFGVIIAIGALWLYAEYNRNHMRVSPAMSEQKDPTYIDMTPAPYESWVQRYEPFDALAGRVGYLCLETPKSKQGLLLVRQRLLEL
ncbi:hypothetical protein PILCRDRAFT_15471 [Piloderma croceum F 1598]|uniref:Uncharacterized protein n=1 Tax=Piloderma croceum (strain F 1598) TaxID=765440 RepID=A0A0C3B774_PILCF|nr:hypothetical protein PILCRDRAFT_15471 [Piloderma croceum F 1598]